MKSNTPKNFVIQLGSLITLYISLTSLIMLMFGVINILYPDALEYYGTIQSTQESMRASIAFLIVFFPAYITLTRISNQQRRQNEAGEYTTLAKWLVYISLLVGGGVLLGDLVTVLMYFLNGEITTRFILKALTLLVIVGVTLAYYILDAKGSFKKNEKLSLQFGMGAIGIVVIALLVGFTHIETPASVRDMRLDEQQVYDLQQMQMYIEEYYRLENALPTTTEAVAGLALITPPEGRENYVYNLIDSETYELCATFLQPSTNEDERYVAIPLTKGYYTWTHGIGETCFKRVLPQAEPVELVD